MNKKALLLTAAFLSACIITALLFFSLNSFHYQRALGFQVLPDGNILVTDGGGALWTNTGSKVFIINKKGKVLWKYEKGISFAHSAVMRQNGNILIPDTNNDRLIEVNKAGEIIFSSENWNNGTGLYSDGTKMDYPNFVMETPEGNLLISSRYSSSVIESDWQGNTVWVYKKLRLQHAPVRLENGNTLISDSDGNRIIEVDRKGKTVWEYKNGLNWPRHARRLKSGNTLIADSNNNRVLEVAPDGKTVFEFGKGVLAWPYQADELESGNILIADAQRGKLIEVDRQGNVVWKFQRSNELLMWLKLPSKVKNGGAEQLNAKGLPKHWYVCDLVSPEGGTWSADKNIKFSGDVSFRIDGVGGEGQNRFWGQYLKVKKGAKSVVLSCMIRTKDVKEGAGMSINFVNRDRGLRGGVNSRIFKGGSEWTEIIITSAVPENAAVIGIVLSLVGPGTAWWDDVRLSYK